jgi:hypothetical protein
MKHRKPMTTKTKHGAKLRLGRLTSQQLISLHEAVCHAIETRNRTGRGGVEVPLPVGAVVLRVVSVHEGAPWEKVAP